ncbi:MAG: TIGR01620 family protein [Pseudomonadota bacterium]
MKKPVIIQADDLPPSQETVADAPPVPDPDLPLTAVQRAAQTVGARRGPLARLVLWALAGLVGLSVSLMGWDFVTGLLARNWILGQIALGLSLIVLAGLITWILREIAGIARLSRIDVLQNLASDPSAMIDRTVALRVLDRLTALYASREDMRLPIRTLAERRDEILDADALMTEVEGALMGPLDARARREIEAATRQVAAATALVPLALADVVVALVANTRMIRRIATIYAGRAGTFGSWRLLRAVASHLIATGAVAVGDDLISSVAGGGVVAKVSRRFGEGVINGALTARVGVAAMEVCRPMPFRAAPKPRVTRLIQRALAGLFGNGT